MNKPFISLSPEITRANALTLMDWLADEEVTHYLSDSRHVSRFIEQVIGAPRRFVWKPTATIAVGRSAV